MEAYELWVAGDCLQRLPRSSGAGQRRQETGLSFQCDPFALANAISLLGTNRHCANAWAMLVETRCKYDLRNPACGEDFFPLSRRPISKDCEH